MSAQLDLEPGLYPTHTCDRACRELADRHYSRRTIGAARFVYGARSLILRDAAGLVVFAWLWPRDEYRDDGRYGYHNVLFRNEGTRLSSDVILEAEAWVLRTWGPRRAWTFVDSRHVRSTNPGYCYLVAGWHRAGMTVGNKRPRKHVLAKDLGVPRLDSQPERRTIVA